MAGLAASGVADLIRDALLELASRKVRSVLLILAVTLSVGALLSSVGISTVAARQVDADLAASAVDLVTVTAAATTGEQTGSAFPHDAEARLDATGLVSASGRRLDLDGITTMRVARSPQSSSVTDVVVSGLTPGYLSVIRARTTTDAAWMLGGSSPVVVLGSAAAQSLSVPVTGSLTGYVAWINGIRHDVVAVVTSSDLDVSPLVGIPFDEAVTWAGSDSAARLLIRAVPGAGAPVAGSARLALRPDAPERLRSSQVSDLSSVRRGVSTQLDRQAAWVGVLLLLLSVLLIANAMVMSVLVRASEIGLRRALGASRRSVAAVFLAEGGLIGVLGGLSGSGLGACAVVVVAAANHWTATLGLWVVLGPALGLGVGLVSSAYPALRAAAVEPGLAVRAD